MPDFEGEVSYGPDAAFALITAGEEPTLACVVRGCTTVPVTAAVCRSCRTVEYTCAAHLARAQEHYARIELGAMYGAHPPIVWRMGCCGALVSTFHGAMEVVAL